MFHRGNSGRVVGWEEVSSREKTEAADRIQFPTTLPLRPLELHWGSSLRKWCPLLAKSGRAIGGKGPTDRIRDNDTMLPNTARC